MDRVKFDYFMPQSPDDAPAARGRPCCHRQRAHYLHPDRDLKFRRVEELQQVRQAV